MLYEVITKEVGELLKGTVSKSGVNHRLRKIDEMAEKIRNAWICSASVLLVCML